MKKFAFRLERLGKLRERTREQKRLAHAEAIDYQRRVESQLAQLQDLRHRERLALADTLVEGRISVENVIGSRVFDGRLAQYTQHLQRQLSQIAQVVAARRVELIAAERDVRILEKLEVRQRQRHDEASNRAEIQTMDEIAGRTPLVSRLA